VIACMERNIRLLLEYDGSLYAGWQTQANADTVQAALQRAIQAATGETAHVQGAGRTDSGVHALGQVANFVTRCRIPVEDLPLALNARLGPGIAVLEAREVPPDFHAQFAARTESSSSEIGVLSFSCSSSLTATVSSSSGSSGRLP